MADGIPPPFLKCNLRAIHCIRQFDINYNNKVIMNIRIKKSTSNDSLILRRAHSRGGTEVEHGNGWWYCCPCEFCCKFHEWEESHFACVCAYFGNLQLKRIKISRPTVRNSRNETCPLNCCCCRQMLCYLAIIIIRWDVLNITYVQHRAIN